MIINPVYVLLILGISVIIGSIVNISIVLSRFFKPTSESYVRPGMRGPVVEFEGHREVFSDERFSKEGYVNIETPVIHSLKSFI
jgi:hypothetical protein